MCPRVCILELTPKCEREGQKRHLDRSGWDQVSFQPVDNVCVGSSNLLTGGNKEFADVSPLPPVCGGSGFSIVSPKKHL